MLDKPLYKKVLEGKRIDPSKLTVTETGQVVKPSRDYVALCIKNAVIQEDVLSLRIENERLKEENERLKKKLEKFFHGRRAQFTIEDTLDVERLKEENTKQAVDRISVELDVKGARKTEYVCPPKSDTGADMYFEMDEGSTMDFILPNGDRYTVGFSSDMMTILGVTAHR